MSAVAVAKEEEEEEEEFDFDCMSEEEDKPASNTVNTVKAEVNNTPVNTPVNPEVNTPATTDRNTEKTEESVNEEDDDGSEDLVDYEMPEIEAGEMEKIEDPLANEGRRKRAHPKVDYVALEAQLKKEEEEMRKKMKKECCPVCSNKHASPLRTRSLPRALLPPVRRTRAPPPSSFSHAWRASSSSASFPSSASRPRPRLGPASQACRPATSSACPP